MNVGIAGEGMRYREVLSMAEYGVHTLTEREVTVWKLIADGLSTKQIAGTLGISFKTAVSHRTSLMGKLGIHEAATLTRYAIRRQLIEP